MLRVLRSGLAHGGHLSALQRSRLARGGIGELQREVSAQRALIAKSRRDRRLGQGMAKPQVTAGSIQAHVRQKHMRCGTDGALAPARLIENPSGSPRPHSLAQAKGLPPEFYQAEARGAPMQLYCGLAALAGAKMPPNPTHRVGSACGTGDAGQYGKGEKGG
jgi:hypothetical protein